MGDRAARGPRVPRGTAVVWKAVTGEGCRPASRTRPSSGHYYGFWCRCLDIALSFLLWKKVRNDVCRLEQCIGSESIHVVVLNPPRPRPELFPFPNRSSGPRSQFHPVSLPQPLAATTPPSVYEVAALGSSCPRDLTTCVLWVRLISCGIVASRFVRAVARVRIFFPSPTCAHSTLCIRSPVHGGGRCARVGVRASAQAPAFRSSPGILGGGLAGSYADSVDVFESPRTAFCS